MAFTVRGWGNSGWYVLAFGVSPHVRNHVSIIVVPWWSNLVPAMPGLAVSWCSMSPDRAVETVDRNAFSCRAPARTGRG